MGRWHCEEVQSNAEKNGQSLCRTIPTRKGAREQAEKQKLKEKKEVREDTQNKRR